MFTFLCLVATVAAFLSGETWAVGITAMLLVLSLMIQQGGEQAKRR